MSDSDIDAILRRIDKLTGVVDALTGQVESLTTRLDARDKKDHDAAVTRAAYWRVVRYGLAFGKSPVTPWLCAGVSVAWATFR